MKLLFVDNFDSFTFNLVDDLSRRGAELEVYRNTESAQSLLGKIQSWTGPKALMLSPGPGSPESAGCCLELIKLAAGQVPIVGVCLGHQALVEALGGRVGRAGEVVHGKSGLITHDQRGLFRGCPSPMPVARYHSLAALELPDCLEVSARLTGAPADLVMAVRHKQWPIIGLQFHPESLLTPHGGQLFENLMENFKE